MTTDPALYNRVRRMAERQGLRLVASRVRDPRALDYGAWLLFDGDTIVYGSSRKTFGRNFKREDVATLDEVEAYLRGERK